MRLVLSGGGTGGHIVPNIALIEELRRSTGIMNLELLYIGSRGGMEAEIVRNVAVPYKGIFCGKLRRYFSLRNLVDMLLIPIGIVQAFFIIRSYKPQAVFCKGGYVSFPVAVGAWLARARVILHESDVVPGLSNRLAARFASVVCVSFEETKQYFPGRDVVVTGNPVRAELLEGVREEGLAVLGFDDGKPVVMFMGGSQGAQFINELVWNNLESLTKHFQVIHICGKGNVRDSSLPHYRAFGYVTIELKDLYAAANVVVTRAGANSLSELEMLGIPAILIPLGKQASRGDQIDNAQAFARSHIAFVMEEKDFDETLFLKKLEELSRRERREFSRDSAAKKIVSLLLQA